MSVRPLGSALVAHPFPLVVEALGVIAAVTVRPAAAASSEAAMRAALPGCDIAILAAAFDGTAVLRARRAARVPTIVLFDLADPDALLAAIELGAEGVLLTTAPLASAAACIAAVAAGEQWLDPQTTRLIIDRVARPAVPALTRRERDVAELVANGQRNRSIADALGISEGTVKMHLHNVYAKLGLESRTQLAMELRDRAA
jgi:two-component system nitrate/nitrite response regulator NarL